MASLHRLALSSFPKAILVDLLIGMRPWFDSPWPPKAAAKGGQEILRLQWLTWNCWGKALKYWSKAFKCWGNAELTDFLSMTFFSSSARLCSAIQLLMCTSDEARVWSMSSSASKLGTRAESTSAASSLLRVKVRRVKTNNTATAKMKTPNPSPIRHAMFQRIRFIASGLFQVGRGKPLLAQDGTGRGAQS